MTKCKICRAPFEKRSMTHKVCGSSCAEILGRQLADKKKLKAEKAVRQKIKERKEKLKTKSDWARETQALCNKYVRLRDEKLGYGCISCNATFSTRWDAGHFRSVGSAPYLRFDADRNIHRQCAKCNTFLAGNLLQYAEYLKVRIGLKKYEELLADNRPKHYTIEDLKGIKASFRLKIKDFDE